MFVPKLENEGFPARFLHHPGVTQVGEWFDPESGATVER